jgi:hypothetical protein
MQARRALASAFACLYVFGAFASLVHVATIEHARCAEHGEVVHADEASAAARLSARPLAASDGLHQGSQEEPHGDHEHCFVLAPAHPDVVSERSPSLLVLRAKERPAEGVFTLPAPVPPAVALWRLAPKQSPPA